MQSNICAFVSVICVYVYLPGRVMAMVICHFILKVWRHIKNPTPSIDAFVIEEQSCPFMPIRFEATEHCAFWRGLPQEEEEEQQQQVNNNKSDMDSVLDPKNYTMSENGSTANRPSFCIIITLRVYLRATLIYSYPLYMRQFCPRTCEHCVDSKHLHEFINIRFHHKVGTQACLFLQIVL